MNNHFKVFSFLCIFVLFAAGCVQQITPTVVPSTPIPPGDAITATAPIPSVSATAPAASATQTALPTPTPVSTQAGQALTLAKIQMLDAQVGWGVGNIPTNPFQRILRTGDGGARWQDVTPPQPVADAASSETAALAAFQDATHAWAAYFMPLPAPTRKPLVVWSTADGGKTWQTSKPLELPTNMDFFMPTNLGFSSLQNGWLMAHLGVGMSHDYIALYRTADGGANWQRVVDPSQDGVLQNSLPMSCSKTGVIFQDAITGWVTGGCNGVISGVFLYQTADGGTTWQPVQVPAPPSNPGLLVNQENVCTTNPVSLPSAHSMVMMMSCRLSGGQTQGWLYTSQDVGKTWAIQALPAAYGTLEFIPAGSGWVLGGASQDPNAPQTLYQSTDAGKTWISVLQPVNWHGQIDFIDPQTGWAVTRQKDVDHLLKTNDGGKTWVEIKPVAVK